MRAARRRTSALLLFSLVGTGCEVAYAGNPVPSVETIVIRMAQARTENQARLRPYSVTRNYRLFGKEKQTTKSEVIANVSFVPPDLKHFVIQQASGMRLGERIVRLMLEHETDIVKNYGSTDMSPANYDFRFLREARAPLLTPCKGNESTAGSCLCYPGQQESSDSFGRGKTTDKTPEQS